MKLYTWQQECLKAWEGNGVPGHWEVAYMGEGTFMAVVAK